MADLDPAAITFARREYKIKNPGLADAVEDWDDPTFLNKAKVCINGRITRSAILLLGKHESAHYLTPGVAQISWILKGERGVDRDYQHFGPPLILAVDQVFAKVRNLTYRHLADASLFPTEITQYDSWVIRESLHNCIAHQDYSLGHKITVVEFPESLLFVNAGAFLPGSVEEVVVRDAPPDVYPNRFLAEAMVNLNMIDTIGSGIRRMFETQQQRSFPMPDYDLSTANQVEVRITGKVLDENFTRLLKAIPDLALLDAIALDKVQKGKPISAHEFKSLKKKKFIEGRRPNLTVSAAVAAATETKVEYIRNRAIDKEHYKRLIMAYLKRFGKATRDDIDKLLLDKLSDALTGDQKRNAVTNLLQEMRRQELIRPVSGKRGRGSRWELYKGTPEGTN